MNRLVQVCATFFGVGYLCWMPGTFASALGALIVWFLPAPSSIFLLAFFLFVGFWIAPASQVVLKSKDPSAFVLDEVCGMMLSLLFVEKTVVFFAAGFVLFRFFDAAKPWPIALLQKNTKPSYILWDDLAAGAISRVILAGLAMFLAGAA